MWLDLGIGLMTMSVIDRGSSKSDGRMPQRISMERIHAGSTGIVNTSIVSGPTAPQRLPIDVPPLGARSTCQVVRLRLCDQLGEYKWLDDQELKAKVVLHAPLGNLSHRRPIDLSGV